MARVAGDSSRRLLAFVNDCQAAVGAVLHDPSCAEAQARLLIARSRAAGPLGRALAGRMILDMTARALLDGRTAARLLRLLGGEEAPGDVPRTSRPAHPIVRRALAAICDEYADVRLSAGQVARGCGVSPWHLSRLLVRHTGQGFVAHLHAARIRKARELMARPDLPLKVVAGAVGYRDVSSFGRHFRATVGIPPGEFRTRLLSARPPAALK